MSPTLLIMGAGVALQAYGKYQEGQQAKQQAEAQAAWAEYNAKIADREAAAAMQAMAFESQQQRTVGRQILSRQRSLIGASGVEMVGSPLLVAEDTASQLALENANIRLTGQKRVSTYKSQSILDRYMADTIRKNASNSGVAGWLSTGGSLLSGFGPSLFSGIFGGGDIGAQAMSQGVSRASALTATGRTASGGFIFGK